ncbi:MAG: hypothetical protein HC902_04885 [Calothrix sp. SM1_5_4]|nr:hypothetical protein [Calothrix sp. SM1_5_4]
MSPRRLLLGLAIMLLSVSSCMQTENTSSLDADLYSDVGGSAEFVAARNVISQSCANCHNYHTQTEAELVAAGLVVRGSPETSKLYYRLAGSSGASGPKNMPTGSSLPQSSLDAISTWIANAQ